MPTFPTLSREPSVMGFEEGMAFDPTFRVQFESGYVLTRPKYTRIQRKWKVSYLAITTANKNLVEEFERDTVYGNSITFDWTHPINSTVYSVRFKGLVKYKMHGIRGRWDIEFELEEA